MEKFNYSMTSGIHATTSAQVQFIIGENITDLELCDLGAAIDLTRQLICLVTIVFGFVGNTIFVVVVAKNQVLHTIVNYYMLNLCLADTLFLVKACIVVTVPVYSYDSLSDENNPTGVCFLWSILPLYLQYVSMFTIAIISIDRYNAICRPLVAHKFHAKNRSVKLVALTWVIAIVFAMTYSLICLDLGIVAVILSLCIQVLPFLITMTTVSVMYYKVVVEMKRRSKTVSHRFKSSANRQKRQTIRVAFTTTLVFFLCTFPFQLFLFLKILETVGYVNGGDLCARRIFFQVTVYLLTVNSAINTFIYTVMSELYRNTLVRTFRSRCKSSSARGLEGNQSIVVNSEFDEQPATRYTFENNGTQMRSVSTNTLVTNVDDIEGGDDRENNNDSEMNDQEITEL